MSLTNINKNSNTQYISDEIDAYKDELINQEELLLQNEELLKYSEQGYGVFFENAPIAYIVTDKDGTIYHYNKLAHRYFPFLHNNPHNKSLLNFTGKKCIDNLLNFLNKDENDKSITIKLSIDFKEDKKNWFKVLKDKFYNNKKDYIILSLTNIQKEYDHIEKINNYKKILKSEKNIIKENELRWKYALEGSGDGVWDWNLKTDEVYFSPRLKSMLGYKDDEFKNNYSEWEKRVHPDDLQKALKDINDHISGKTTHYVNKHRLLCKNGKYKWILDRGVVIEKDKDAKPLRFIGTHSDIDEATKLNEKLKENNELLENISSKLNGVFYKFKADINGNSIFQYISKQIYEVYEITQEELKKDSSKVFEVIHIDDLQLIMDSFNNSFEELLPWVCEYRVNLPKKGLRWLHLESNPIKQSDGSVVWYGYIYDITDEKQKALEREELISEQKTLLSLFDKSDAVLFKWKNDDSFNVEYVSENVFNLTGYTKDEFLNKEVNYMECIHKDDFSHSYDELKNALLNNLDFIRHDPYRLVTRSKKDKWVLDFTVALRDKLGNVTHGIGYLTDITDQMEAQKKLQLAKDIAESASKSKSNFLANISHEIRTPLNGIIGLTDIVLSTELNDEQKEYLNKAYNSSQSLLKILNDILDYSKIEAHKFDIVKSNFKLDKLINTTIDLYSYELKNKNLVFYFDIDKNVPNSLIGDSLRISQVLNNLIGNAIKFTPSGYILLDVSIIDINNKIVKLKFSIKDSGIGINKNNQQKLFNAFEQADTTTTRKFGGTGLGLVICKELTELMGGEITFQSDEGVGSTFELTIPFEYIDDSIYCDIDNVNEENLYKTTNIYLKESKKALIVEDDEINQLVTKTFLKNYGFIVDIAYNGKDAVKKAKTNKYEIIFMDIQMPIMDGYQATKNIRLFDHTTTIVALSATKVDDEVLFLNNTKMDNYLIKPIEKSKLQKLLLNYFEFEKIDSEITQNYDNNTEQLNLNGIDLYEKRIELEIDDMQQLYKIYYTFYQNHIDDIFLLDTVKTDSDEFKKYIHKLKGVTGNLKIYRVYDSCIKIEQEQPTQKNIQILKTHLENVLNEINNKIIPLIKLPKSIITDKKSIISFIDSILIKITNMEYISIDEMEELFSALKTFVSLDEIQNIRQLYNKHDTKKFVEDLSKIRRGI
jgi:PAS domain S-box-containing protein